MSYNRRVGLMRKILIYWLCGIMISGSLFIPFGSQEANGGLQHECEIRYLPSSPFRINSNADFLTSPLVTGGNGTIVSPWTIEGYEINGTGVGYCIYIGNTTDYCVIKNCSFHNANGSTYYPYILNSGVTLYRAQNAIIKNNSISNSYFEGVFILESSYIQILNNTMFNNSFDNIWSYVGNNITILNNTISTGYNGISLTDTSYSIVDGNNIEGHEFGLYMYNATYNSIQGNHIEDCIQEGIVLTEVSNSNTLENNTVLNSLSGIKLQFSDYNEIKKNIFTLNDEYGIYIYLSTGNVIELNNISANVNYGLYLDIACSDNMVFHNSFITNGNQAYTATTTNRWNASYPYGGNYWSDYTGIDVKFGPTQTWPGSDGLGDTPYTTILGAGGQDSFPLMEPWDPNNIFTPVHNINKDTYYMTIQFGIQAASPGDTLVVSPGIYYENVIVNRALTIMGVKNESVIDGSSTGTVVYISSANVNIDGFVIRNAGTNTGPEYYAGVEVEAVNNVKITNCSFYNIPKVGVFYYGAVSNSSVEHCIFDNIQMNCIRIGSSPSHKYYGNRFISNSFKNSVYGIVIQTGDQRDLTMVSNTFGNLSWTGVVFGESCNNIRIARNVFLSGERYAIDIYININDVIIGLVIVENDFYDAVNIGWYASNVTLYHNNFLNGSYASDITGNTWDNGYPSGGNYWYNYTGEDFFSGPYQDQTGSDSIGDTPHTNILGGSGAQDNYPLMDPWTPTQVEVDLTLGWNLVSVPIELSESNITTAMAGMSGMLECVKYYSNLYPADPWKTYRPSSAINDLKIISNSIGLWIKVSQNCSWVVEGTPLYYTNIVLRTGWNLVSYPSETPRTVEDALIGTGFDRVEAFNSTSPYLISEVSSSYMMDSTEGYWVHAPADVLWTVYW